MNKFNGKFEELHTSGHASVGTIGKIIEKLNPKEAIVPVHTENAAGFMELKKYNEIVRICKN